MGLFNFLFGSPPKTEKLPTMSPQQQQLLNQMLQMLGPGGGLGQGYQGALGLQQQLMDPSSEAVQQFTEPYMRAFEEQTVPQLAERFAGAGALGGGLSSSGFGQSLGAAGGQLQSQLAALKAGLGQQAAGQLMNQYGGMLQSGLGMKPFGYAYQPGGTGAFGQALSAWGSKGFPGIGGFGSGIADILANLLPGGV